MHIDGASLWLGQLEKWWCHFTTIFYQCYTLLGGVLQRISKCHYNDVIMGTIAYQITSLTIVYSIVYSDADQRKHQSSASLAFVWPVTRKMFPFDDVIMGEVPRDFVSHFKWRHPVQCRRYATTERRRNFKVNTSMFGVSTTLALLINTLRPSKWPPFSRRHFQMHFLEWKCMNFDWDFTEVCSQGSN